MTFSILARDPETGAFGGAAATGNLCVGAWVLRGDAREGMSAAQGLSPSPLWGGAALELLHEELPAREVINRVIAEDRGRESRQLSVLDREGGTHVFDGAANKPWCGSISERDFVIAGNWLEGPAVLEHKARAFAEVDGSLLERLVRALEAGRDAGGDLRGLQSAAVMVLAPDRPPLDLRIDYDPNPIEALKLLVGRVMLDEYQTWLGTIPTLDDPEKT
jgi:uncharacterized Ntn-hydrolase superfamily protein